MVQRLTTDDFQVPAVIFGVVLGPIAAKFLDSERWGSRETGQTSEITLVSTGTRFKLLSDTELFCRASRE